MPNPKPEHQRPKEIRRPKAESTAAPTAQEPIGSGRARISGFGLLSGFGLRPSDFSATNIVIAFTGAVAPVKQLGPLERPDPILLIVRIFFPAGSRQTSRSRFGMKIWLFA
jgi:hypothetical protein